ncbi:hypothetical protein [Spiroplasma endosymbiont of Amphimallon solstitiale]
MYHYFSTKLKENYVEDKFGYTVVNHLSDINWEKEPDKNIEPVR